METASEEYKEHLEQKYLPGRDKYLRWFYYPKLLRQFGPGKIWDLGCGTGEFLKYVRSKGREIVGADHNPHLVELCRKLGFEVIVDDVTRLDHVPAGVQNAILDNVLEHLDKDQIDAFFAQISSRLANDGRVVVAVPYKKGYKYDPTHKTFVQKELVQSMCGKYGLRLSKFFYHPVNLELVGRLLYLNMQVFVITK